MKGIKMFKTIFALIGGLLGFMFGELDGFITALIVFVIVDYTTGVMCAIAEKRLSSEVGAKGIMKKVVIFALVDPQRSWRIHIPHNGHILLPGERGPEHNRERRKARPAGTAETQGGTRTAE